MKAAVLPLLAAIGILALVLCQTGVPGGASPSAPRVHTIDAPGPHAPELAGRAAEHGTHAAETEEPFALSQALVRSAAIAPTSSPVPPMPKMTGGGVVEFDHRGDRLASEGAGGVVVWDRTTWSLVARVEVDGSLSALRFSPDDRHLYVAGGGFRKAVLARYEASTGRLDRTYEGHGGAISDMVLSPDGRILATFGEREKEILFHDADSGAVIRRAPAAGWRMLAAPGGNGVLWRRSDADWILQPLATGSASALRLPVPDTLASLSSLATTEEATVLVIVNRDVEPPFSERPGSITACRAQANGWSVAQEIVLESATMLQRTALSRDGRFLAAAGDGNVVRVYSVPELREIGTVKFPTSRASNSTIESLSFSADDEILAVGMHTPMPALVRLRTSGHATLERFDPWFGHADEIECIRFVDGGKLLRTRARDQTVCAWDTDTLEMRGRFRLPDGFEGLEGGEAESPWILCVPEGWPADDMPAGWPLKVVDAESGRVLFDTKLPAGFDPGSARRLSDGRLLVVSDDRTRICSFDCAREAGIFTSLAGERIAGNGEVSADGRLLYVPSWVFQRGDVPEYVRVDLRTGDCVRVRDAREASVVARFAGFVPGDRFAYSAGPEFRLYELGDLREVLRRPLDSPDPHAITFSRDGARYAVLHDLDKLETRARTVVPPGSRAVLAVHDTLSGTTLLAASLPTYTRLVALDADGQRVVVVGGDGRLTLWSVPSASR